MPVTQLDARSALVLIDLQNGTLGQNLATPAADLVARALELAAEFHRRDLPIAVVTAIGTPPGRTEYSGRVPTSFPAQFSELPEAIATLAADIRIAKTSWGAFVGTQLHDELSARGITQVVLAGLATSFGIESSAREAYDLGYSVIIATDAISDPNPASHEHSLRQVFPALAELAITADIIAL
ncbi:MAG: isochorismatase family cysteine hydrolase [Gordonia sp. (in: high G+C Gram-positive bacteria)]